MKRMISRCCCMIGGGMAAVGSMGLDTESAAGFFLAFALTAVGLVIVGTGLLIRKASGMDDLRGSLQGKTTPGKKRGKAA